MLLLPNGFQATPTRGSSAVQIHLMPALGPGVLARDQELSVGRIEVRLRLATSLLGRHHRPGQTQIQRQVLADAPVILDERTVDFPAAPGVSAVELLIMETDRLVSRSADPPPARRSQTTVTTQNPFGKPTATVFS